MITIKVTFDNATFVADTIVDQEILYIIGPIIPNFVKLSSSLKKQSCNKVTVTVTTLYLFWWKLSILQKYCVGQLLAWACSVPVGRRSGGRLATTLVATINVIIFSFFYSVVYFSHRRSAQIKKLFWRKLLRMPKT